MNKYGKVSVILAGLALPTALLLSSLIAWHLKSTNPDSVDITAGLAYLRPILLTSFSTYGVMWLVSLVSGLLGLKRDASDELSRVGLMLLILVTVVSLASGITSRKIADAEDAYRATQTNQEL